MSPDDKDKLLFENANKYRLHQDVVRWTLFGGYAVFLAAFFTFTQENQPSEKMILLFFFGGICYMFILGVENFFYKLYSDYAKECEGRLDGKDALCTLQAFIDNRSGKTSTFHPSFFFALVIVSLGNCAISLSITGCDIYVLCGINILVSVLILRWWNKIVYRRIIKPIQCIFDTRN